MRLEEFFDAVDFDPNDFDVGPTGGGPLLWLVLKPKPEDAQLKRLRKLKKRKKRKVDRTLFQQQGMPVPSPQFFHLLDILDTLGYLDLLVRGA